MAKRVFSSPVPVGCRYTSGFMTKARPDHAGSDWAPPKPGQTDIEVRAVTAGKVKKTGNGNVWAHHTGNAIALDHGKLSGNGSTDQTETYYGHLAKILVKEGQQVEAGELIAIMGNTGNSTNVHLHLGVKFGRVKNGKVGPMKLADPAAWLKTKGITPGKTKPVEGHKPAADPKIADWQRSMNKLFPAYADFAVDGRYEDYSEKVTSEFQRRTGIKRTGKLDANTVKTMRAYGVNI